MVHTAIWILQLKKRVLDSTKSKLISSSNIGSVSGAIHIDNSIDANNDGDTDDSQELFNIEQAHFTYSLDNGVNFTFGQYGSALGFEREDPAGLYTYSRAYGDGTY